MQSGVPSHRTVATLAQVTPNGSCGSWRARGGQGRAGEGTGPDGGGGGCHSAWINLCPPLTPPRAPGEAAARSPLPSLSKHLLTPLLSAIDCRLVDTTGSCKFIMRTAGNQTQHRVLGGGGNGEGHTPSFAPTHRAPVRLGSPPVITGHRVQHSALQHCPIGLSTPHSSLLPGGPHTAPPQPQ